MMRTPVFLHAPMLTLILTLTLAPLSACAPAQATPALFGEYEPGTPKSELLARSGMKPGEGSMAGDLILPGVSWAGCEWTAQFGFERDKLTTVTLLGRYERERFNAVRRHLSANGFEILGIVVDEKALDLFALIKSEGVEAFQKRFMELLRARTPARISYEWFMTRNVSEDQKKMANSMGEFLHMVDVNILQAEVTQLGDDSSSGPQALLVSFFFPVINAANHSEK